MIDAFELFEAIDREQSERMKRLPKCDFCFNPVQDEYFYEIEGEVFCPDCMRRYFRKRVEDYVE